MKDSIVPNNSLSNPRILFLGTASNFSRPPLEALLADGLIVCAVVMSGGGRTAGLQTGGSGERTVGHRAGGGGERTAGFPTGRGGAAIGRATLPLLNPFINRTIAQIAWERQIPVVEVGKLADPEMLARLAAFQPDVICVACFPQRLPKAVLDLPPLGCLNLHPSLLPAYRGPAPGFWVLHNREVQTGVTVHLMDARFDTGDILLQQAFAIPPGISSDALEQCCAEVGAPLLAQAVRALAAGTAVRMKQNEQQSSYYSWPREADFEAAAQDEGKP